MDKEQTILKEKNQDTILKYIEDILINNRFQRIVDVEEVCSNILEDTWRIYGPKTGAYEQYLVVVNLNQNSIGKLKKFLFQQEHLYTELRKQLKGTFDKNVSLLLCVRNATIEYSEEEIIGSHQQNKSEMLQEKSILKIEEDQLNDFNKRLVEDMHLSFFLYTGRILQNYPGGLGIKMQMSGESKIRFEAPNRKEHDVFYTLSSGQLSAVAIALALTLNKIYAPKSFRCIMIDDPIQTMDELNISSFVEMLRNDFSEYQFIISTHEDNFSDYIRYKYEKYGLSNKYISVQELENEESRELQQP